MWHGGYTVLCRYVADPASRGEIRVGRRLSRPQRRSAESAGQSWLTELNRSRQKPPSMLTRISSLTESESIPMPWLIALHLVPGLLILLVYLLLARPTAQLGYPPVMALLPRPSLVSLGSN